VNKIFTTLITENASNYGFTFQNSKSKCAIIINKKILKDKHDYFINESWYGYINEQTYDATKSKTSSNEFKDVINKIDENVQNSQHLNQAEVMFNSPIDIKKYAIGFTFMFGVIGNDFNIDFELLFNSPMYKALENVPDNIKGHIVDLYEIINILLFKIKKYDKRVYIMISELDIDKVIKF
jgi:hypothetical protein